MSNDERAVSIAITHALTVAITTVLVSGLLISSGTLLQSQEERVGSQQISEIGSDVTSHIHHFDRMYDRNAESNATVEPKYPSQIVESYSYVIELREEGGDAVVEVRTHRLDESAEYELDVDAEIDEAAVSGGIVEINLCEGDEITLGGCS